MIKGIWMNIACALFRVSGLDSQANMSETFRASGGNGKRRNFAHETGNKFSGVIMASTSAVLGPQEQKPNATSGEAYKEYILKCIDSGAEFALYDADATIPKLFLFRPKPVRGITYTFYCFDEHTEAESKARRYAGQKVMVTGWPVEGTRNYLYVKDIRPV